MVSKIDRSAKKVYSKSCSNMHCENHVKYDRKCSKCRNFMSLYTYHKNKNITIFCEKCQKFIKKYNYNKHILTQIHMKYSKNFNEIC